MSGHMTQVQEGPEGFPFLKNEKYIFKYSFRAVDGMEVATRFTHLGQLKGSAGGYMISGDPIYSLTANKHGLMVRFSNLESIEDFYAGFDDHLDWDDATGEWVHVEIITTFGESMEVKRKTKQRFKGGGGVRCRKVRRARVMIWVIALSGQTLFFD